MHLRFGTWVFFQDRTDGAKVGDGGVLLSLLVWWRSFCLAVINGVRYYVTYGEAFTTYGVLAWVCCFSLMPSSDVGGPMFKRGSWSYVE